MTTGTVALFHGPDQSFSLQTHRLPRLKAGELLVKISLSTLCASDLHSVSGRRRVDTPVVLGHEIVGRVAALPAGGVQDLRGQALAEGDRVSWSIFAAPADDAWARRGLRQKSPAKQKYGHARLSEAWTFSGGLATHCHLLAGTCVQKVSEALPDAALCPANCSLATVVGAFRLAGALKDQRVLITGGGMLGLHAAAYARTQGARQVTVADVDAHRLERAQHFGADQLLLVEAGTSFSPSSADLVLDTSGAKPAMQAGLQALEIGGTAVWVGAVFPQGSLPVDPEQVVRNLWTLKGLHNYNEQDFAQALAYLEAHHADFPFEELVEKTFSLDQVDEAFAYAREQRPFRVGVRPGHP